MTVLRVIAGDWPVAGPFQTPFERPDLAIGGAGTQTVLPIVHPLRIKFPHESSTSLREAERAHRKSGVRRWVEPEGGVRRWVRTKKMGCAASDNGPPQ